MYISLRLIRYWLRFQRYHFHNLWDAFPEIILVGARGFEPPTPCAQGRCATRLRYAPTETRTTLRILNQFSPGCFCYSNLPVSRERLAHVRQVLTGSPNKHHSSATQLHRHWLRLRHWRKSTCCGSLRTSTANMICTWPLRSPTPLPSNPLIGWILFWNSSLKFATVSLMFPIDRDSV